MFLIQTLLSLKDEAKQAHIDQRYISGLIEGDSEVIKEIYQLFYAQIELYVQKNKGTRDDAKDLFSEVLKIIYLQGRKNLKLERSFGGYLRTICQRRWINHLKRQKRFDPDIEEQAEPEDDEHFTDKLLEQERRLLYRKHFDLLPERCRQILEFSFQGLNYREVAEKLNMNYSFIRRRGGACTQQLIDSVKQDPIFEELI